MFALEKTTGSEQLDSSQSKYPGHQQIRGADEEVRSLEEEKEAVLYPDGGYGWAVTFGIFLALLLMGGLQFCWYDSCCCFCIEMLTNIFRGEFLLYYLSQISAKNSYVALCSAKKDINSLFEKELCKIIMSEKYLVTRVILQYSFHLQVHWSLS